MNTRNVSVRIRAAAVGVSIAASLIYAGGCRDGGRVETAERPVAVRVARPQRMDLRVKSPHVGTVHRQKEIRVAARIPATVESLPWREGDIVPAGARIAELAAPELAATARRLRVESDYWYRRHEVDLRLAEAGALPRDKAEESERGYKSAKAALAEAEAQLAKTVESAPFGGTVLRRFVEPGQHVLPGQALLLMGEGTLEIHVEVVEEDLARGIDVGTVTEIRSRGEVEFRSSVSEVAPIAAGLSRTFTVKTPVPADHAGGLRVGASMSIDFLLDFKRDCVAVPVEAIQKAVDGTHLFVIREGAAVRMPVDVGVEENGFVEVSLDWNGEDPVAVSNLEGLSHGVPVFPVPVERPGS